MSSANWFNGTADVVWNNNDFAVFAGNPGVVELSTGINAGSVTFHTANYTLANDTTGSVVADRIGVVELTELSA